MPHITEELWYRMGFGEFHHPIRSLDGLRINEAGLIPLDIAFARQVYEATTIARNLRAEYRIPSNKKVRR